MAGHNKWSKVKHIKGAADAKRSKMFTKFIKEITIAARLGGGDPDGNPRLRLAIEKARAQSMPKDNIEKAIKRGTGELEGQEIQEVSYEGYGPAGVAIIVECTTDNTNRTVADVRSRFSKKGGNMGESGSVAWMFDRKGVIHVDAASTSEEELFDKALEAGAEDVKKEDDEFVVMTAFEDYISVVEDLQKQDVAVKESNLEMIPQNTIKIEDAETAEKLLNLLENLEDSDDVQNVWANFEMEDSLMEQVSGG